MQNFKLQIKTKGQVTQLSRKRFFKFEIFRQRRIRLYEIFLWRRNLKLSEGFTLVEIMVVVFVFTLIAYGLIALMSYIFTVSSTKGGLISDQDQARKLASQIVKELRNGQTGLNGAYVLDTAGDQQLIFYSNADRDSGIERVRYYVQGGKLYRGVTEWNGSSYNTSTEQSVAAQNDLANGSGPVFYYYDGTYTGAANQSALTQPVNVTQVKFVKVAVKVYNKTGVSNTNSFTVTASGAIRNLKTNLGN